MYTFQPLKNYHPTYMYVHTYLNGIESQEPYNPFFAILYIHF
jgi:hypothetical protein